MMQRRSRPQRTPWGPGPNYKEVWKTSVQRREGGVSSEQPPRFNASLPPRRPSPPISPLLAPASSSLYDEFYPWRSEDIPDYWEEVFVGDCLVEDEGLWRDGFEAGMCLSEMMGLGESSLSKTQEMPMPHITRKDPPSFNEDFEYLYVTDMRSTMGKHCALIFTDSVSWLSKKRCPKRCRVYVVPGVHLAINDLFKNKFEWSKIAINEMWHSRQNNCKEVCHRHKHNANHIIRNLIISKSPIPRMN